MNEMKSNNINFNSHYKKKGYDKKLWPILNEFFSRYQTTFDLSYEELYNKLKRIINNLDEIKIEGKASDEYMGMYYPSDKKLAVNIEKLEYLNMKDEDVLSTIFHELNHATEEGLTYGESSSFQLYNGETNLWEGTALNEIITEMKANVLAKNNNRNILNQTGDDRRTKNLNGYGDLIFVGTMLHTALGLTEKEFLKLADKGKEEFDNAMKLKFPEAEDYTNFISHISFYADTIHAIYYNKDHNQYTSEDYTNLNNCINGIYDNCIYALGQRTKKEVFFGRDNMDASSYILEAGFNLETLSINYKKGMSYVFDISDVEPRDNPYYKQTKDTITSLDVVEKARERLNTNQYNDLMSRICFSNDINLDELLYTYGISRDDSTLNNTVDLNTESNILKKYYEDKNWDNSKIGKDIKRFKIKSFFDRLKGRFSFLRSKKDLPELPGNVQIGYAAKTPNFNLDNLVYAPGNVEASKSYLNMDNPLLEDKGDPNKEI